MILNVAVNGGGVLKLGEPGPGFSRANLVRLFMGTIGLRLIHSVLLRDLVSGELLLAHSLSDIC